MSSGAEIPKNQEEVLNKGEVGPNDLKTNEKPPEQEQGGKTGGFPNPDEKKDEENSSNPNEPGGFEEEEETGEVLIKAFRETDEKIFLTNVAFNNLTFDVSILPSSLDSDVKFDLENANPSRQFRINGFLTYSTTSKVISFFKEIQEKEVSSFTILIPGLTFREISDGNAKVFVEISSTSQPFTHPSPPEYFTLPKIPKIDQVTIIQEIDTPKKQKLSVFIKPHAQFTIIGLQAKSPNPDEEDLDVSFDLQNDKFGILRSVHHKIFLKSFDKTQFKVTFQTPYNLFERFDIKVSVYFESATNE